VVTDIEFSIAVREEQDRAALAGIARRIQEFPETAARAAIVG
jgi:hypothetical protein